MDHSLVNSYYVVCFVEAVIDEPGGALHCLLLLTSLGHCNVCACVCVCERNHETRDCNKITGILQFHIVTKLPTF